MDLEYDLGEEVDEQKVEAGGKLPPGWYLAVVDDIFPDPANPCLKVIYKITHGPYAGKQPTDTIWDPAASDTPDKAKSAKARMNLVGGRIGARDEGTTRFNWLRCIGNAVVLEMAHKQKRWCNKCDTERDEKGIQKCPQCGEKLSWKDDPSSFVNVAYDGVYPLDHEKLGDAVRRELGITVPRRIKGPAAGGATGGGQANATRSAPTQSTQNGHRVDAVQPPVMSREERLAKATADL